MNTAAENSPAISNFVSDKIFNGRTLLFLHCCIICTFHYKLTCSRQLKNVITGVKERMVLV